MKFLVLLISLLFQISNAQVQSLQAEDGLAKIVRQISKEWKDLNISTGTTEIKSGIWTVPVDKIPEMQNALLRTEVQKIAGKAAKLENLQVVASVYNPSDVILLAKIFQIGNAYSPDNQHSLKMAIEQINTILEKLTQLQTKDLFTIALKAVYREGAGTRNVYLTSITSLKSNQTVLFFVIEGSI